MALNFCPTCFADLSPGEICSRCGVDRSSADFPGDVLQPGCVLAGKYKVGRLLGRGGFGATYLAWDLNLQVRIAIKEFLPRQLAARTSGGVRVSAYTGGQEGFNIGLQQFLSEARNLAQFRDHPGIISVLDFFPENGTGYMVMEYLDGSTLEQYVGSVGNLDTQVVLQLLVPVADALRACHAAGLIHRDVSPDNIFVTTDGRVKLLDFGAARFAIGSRSTNLSVILKEGYAPFEQYQRNGRQGPWTDVYALTGTLYRLLTGVLPVAAPDRIAGTHLPSPAEKGVKVSGALQALLDKGLALQPQERYQKVEELLSDLQAILGERRSPPMSDAPVWGRWKRAVVPVGAVVLAGVAATLAVLWLYRPTSTPTPTPTPEARAVITTPPAERPITTEDHVSKPPEPRPAFTNPPADQEISTEAHAAKPPEPSLDATIGSIREYIKNGVQDQLQLRLALTQARAASTTLSKLQQVSVRNEVIDQAIRKQEMLYKSAIADQEDSLNKYLADVAWLAGHQDTAVDTAVQMEEESANTATIDPRKADAKAQISSALDQLRRDIRDQRQGRLAREAIADRLTVGEAK